MSNGHDDELTTPEGDGDVFPVAGEFENSALQIETSQLPSHVVHEASGDAARVPDEPTGLSCLPDDANPTGAETVGDGKRSTLGFKNAVVRGWKIMISALLLITAFFAVYTLGQANQSPVVVNPAWISQIDLYTAIAVIASIALAILGGLVSIFVTWTQKHRAKILAGFLVLGCIGTLAAIIAAAKSAQDLKDANANLKASVEEGKREVLYTYTGGDSFCFAMVSPSLPEKWKILNLAIITQGKYELHGVRLYFSDPDKARNMWMQSVARGTQFDQKEAIKQTSYLTTLAPSRDKFLLPISFNYLPLQTKSQEFSLSFDGPNGHWDEVLRLQLINGKWVQALQVTRSIPDQDGYSIKKQELLRYADQDYPRPVDWSEHLSPLGLTGVD